MPFNIKDMLSKEDQDMLSQALTNPRDMYKEARDRDVVDREEDTILAKQGMAETPIGSMLGMEVSPEQKARLQAIRALRTPQQQASRDESREITERMAGLGMGMGGINNMAPKALKALKGAAAKVGEAIAEPNLINKAVKTLPEGTDAGTSTTFTTPFDDIVDPALKKMLHEREMERLEGIVNRTNSILGKEGIKSEEFEPLKREIMRAQERRDNFRKFMDSKYPKKVE